MAGKSPMDIYRLLPGTNCKECGLESCMGFASALIERTKTVDDCPPFKDPKYADKLGKLIDFMTPPVKPVVIGTGDRAVTIGGEEVMYRHELTYFNQTAFAFDVDDEMSPEELKDKVRKISNYTITRVGQDLSYEAIAIRSKSGDPTKYGDAVLTVTETTDMPLILCCLNPDSLEVGLEIAAGRRPLIYAATKDNWEAVVNLALKHNCPVVASSPGDIQGVSDLVGLLEANGVQNIVLDIGTYSKGEAFGNMVDQLVQIRRLAVDEGVRSLGYPVMGVPAVAWLAEEDPIEAGRQEGVLTATLILKYASLAIIHSSEIWSVLPNLTLRQNIYTDPRKPIKVDPGLYSLGGADENSPVLVTTNFALTYYTVEGDVMAGKVAAHVIVVDTDGLAVEPAMAGGKLTASSVKDVIDASGAEEKINHRKLILPGMATRISGEVEEATGWEAIIGPIDSSRIPGFIEEKWKA